MYAPWAIKLAELRKLSLGARQSTLTVLDVIVRPIVTGGSPAECRAGRCGHLLKTDTLEIGEAAAGERPLVPRISFQICAMSLYFGCVYIDSCLDVFPDLWQTPKTWSKNMLSHALFADTNPIPFDCVTLSDALDRLVVMQMSTPISSKCKTYSAGFSLPLLGLDGIVRVSECF
jgi:hypothetical protein